MNTNKRAIISLSCLIAVLAISTTWLLIHPKTVKNSNTTDEALLALIKNDRVAFERFITQGGDIHGNLPEIDGRTYTVAEGISHFERSSFAELLHQKKIHYVRQADAKPFDILTIAVKKNNPELWTQLAKENPIYYLQYGSNGWTLLHMASAWCSQKLTSMLHDKGKLNWDLQAKDGSTPLTLAAENDCLPMLSYWKEKGANFRAKDGKGRTALSILRGKKDAALTAFAESFDDRRIAAVSGSKVIPDFYKKRKIPKDQIVDHAAMLEPEDRPLEATETAEFSEFAD